MVIAVKRDPKNHGIRRYNVVLDHDIPRDELALGQVHKPKKVVIATVGKRGVFDHEVPEDKSAIFYSVDEKTGEYQCMLH